MEFLGGHLLVASPRLPDPNFSRSVVLIIHHDEQGAFGLILNRPTESTVAEVWKRIAHRPCHARQPLNLGGPVNGPLVALHTKEECSEREVLPGVHFATHKDYLNKIVADPKNPFRIFTGYSGWGAGQLDGEMEVGGWMTLPARSDHVFGEAESMWNRAAQEIGEQITTPLVARCGVPADPGMN
jgi:putative transcriptional regulator